MHFFSSFCAEWTTIHVSYGLVDNFGWELQQGKLCLFQYISLDTHNSQAWNAGIMMCCVPLFPRPLVGAGSCFDPNMTPSSMQRLVAPIAAANVEHCCYSFLGWCVLHIRYSHGSNWCHQPPLVPIILGPSRVPGEVGICSLKFDCSFSYLDLNIWVKSKWTSCCLLARMDITLLAWRLAPCNEILLPACCITTGHAVVPREIYQLCKSIHFLN